MEERRLQWRPSVWITPRSFIGHFEDENVGGIAMVGERLPMHGTWDYRLTYHGMYCSFLPSLSVKKSGNSPTKQAAADEVTRLWWLVYDEMQDAGMNWRDFIGCGAVWNRG